MSTRIPITVGLAVYNGVKTIRKSLGSLLCQTFTDFELVISDNASTDGTEDICREYAARDPRIRYHRATENQGGYRNFNRIVQLARGKYLKWSTSDDYWAPQMLEKTFETLENDPTIALCYPKTMLCDEYGTPTEPYEDNLHLMQDNAADRFIALLENIGLCHPQYGLIRRDVLSSTALFGDFLWTDRNLLAELTLYGKFFEYPERLYFRRLGPESANWVRGTSREAHERHMDFLDPHRRRKVKRQVWARHRAFLNACRRAPLSTRDRRRLYWYLARSMWWEKEGLAAELVTGRASA